MFDIFWCILFRQLKKSLTKMLYLIGWLDKNIPRKFIEQNVCCEFFSITDSIIKSVEIFINQMFFATKTQDGKYKGPYKGLYG